MSVIYTTRDHPNLSLYLVKYHSEYSYEDYFLILKSRDHNKIWEKRRNQMFDTFAVSRGYTQAILKAFRANKSQIPQIIIKVLRDEYKVEP